MRGKKDGGLVILGAAIIIVAYLISCLLVLGAGVWVVVKVLQYMGVL